MIELVQRNIVGTWKDTWTNVTTGEVSYSNGIAEFQSNQLQNTLCDLFAYMCQQDPGDPTYGIQYMACGSGESSWDVTPPTQSYDQTTLTTETYREPTWEYIGGDTPYYLNYWSYIDPVTFAESGSPTRAIACDMIIFAGDATGLHREFGLFGGVTATSSPDTGYMINWVVIDVHDKLVGEQLDRTMRLFFPEQ